MTCILEAFDGDDRGLGISELALRAGLPKSTVSRLVATLVRQRYLERDGKLIHLGLRLFELGQLAEQPRELRIAALPVMADLRNQTGENVHLAIRDGGEVVCIAVMRGRSAGPSTVRTGGRLPLHATALGKAVLAHDSPSGIDDVLSAGLAPWTRQTITDPAVLRRQLAGIRRGGLAARGGGVRDRCVLHRDPRCSRPGAGWRAPCRCRGTRRSSTRTVSPSAARGCADARASSRSAQRPCGLKPRRRALSRCGDPSSWRRPCRR